MQSFRALYSDRMLILLQTACTLLRLFFVHDWHNRVLCTIGFVCKETTFGKRKLSCFLQRTICLLKFDSSLWHNPVTCLLLWLRLYYCYNKYNAKCNMRIVLCRACVPLPNWRTKIDCHKDSINLPLLFIRVSLYVYFVSSRCHSLFIHNSYWLLSSLD